VYAAPFAILLLAIGLNRGSIGGLHVIADHFDNKTFPVIAVDRARTAHLPGRVFDAWGWGGYIMYAWPEASLHVDPLKFNDTTIKTYETIEELRPDWLKELSRWKVQTIIVNSKSPMAKALATAPGWTRWYGDSTAVVYRASPVPSL
jgi:hypothetical protein